MKMRNIAILLFVTVSVAGTMDAAGKKRSSTGRQQPTCDKIVHGTKEESFGQRISCARRAMAAGNYAQAYELLVPVYKHAKTSKSNTARDSKAKLGAIVTDRLGSNAKNLLDKYNVEDVYVALAIVDDVDASSGKKGMDAKKTNRYALPEGLVDEVKATMTVMPVTEEFLPWPARTPSAPIASTRPMPTPSAPVESVEKGIAEWQNIMAKEELMIFTLNALLTTVFEKTLDQGDFELANALTQTVKRANNEDIALLKEIVKKMQIGYGINEAYDYLIKQRSSWLGQFGVLVRPDWKSYDYVEQWVQTSPDSKLIAILQGENQLKQDTLSKAQQYLNGTAIVRFDDMFRRAEAIRLARTAAGFLSGDVLRSRTKDEKYVMETYKRLVASLDLDTNKQIKLPMERGDLNSISAQLGEIQGNLLVDSIPADKISMKDKIALKLTFSKTAKIGGVVAVTALVALIATKTQIGQDAIKKAGESISSLYGYLPSVPDNVKAYVPSLSGIGAAAGTAFEKVKGAAQMIPGASLVTRATGAVIGGVLTLTAGAIRSELVTWLGSKVSSQFAASVAQVRTGAQFQEPAEIYYEAPESFAP